MKTRQLLLRAILMLMTVVGWQTSDAQILVLHLSDGTLVNIPMNSKFRMANLGEKTYVTMPDGSMVEYDRSAINMITYEGNASGSGDVNGDGNVDVADIGAVIDIMAGNEEAQGSFTKCPNNNHPHKIDLGLPSGTKWACCNVGALTPESYGDIFAWGETKMRDDDAYTWETYTHCDGSYNTCHDLGLDIAKTAYDAATVNWHIPWRMPTFDQLKELIDNTTAVYTNQNGVNGMKFTAKNGASIFLPAAGSWWNDTSIQGRGQVGCYWSSTINQNSTYRAVYLYFYSNTPYKTISYKEVAAGQSVRPVAE
ncbi:MAG: hypothetical protein J6W19_03480 [Prevotella sp.]|nr:hypothetical protein [Prevotella sp.]